MAGRDDRLGKGCVIQGGTVNLVFVSERFLFESRLCDFVFKFDLIEVNSSESLFAYVRFE